MQPSSTEEEFGDVLGRILTETRTSVRRLEALSSVSRRTVENWLHGPVRRPRREDAADAEDQGGGSAEEKPGV